MGCDSPPVLSNSPTAPLQSGPRAWDERQTGHPLGYVEQLYTFADRDRVGEGPEQFNAPAETIIHIVLKGCGVRCDKDSPDSRPSGSITRTQKRQRRDISGDDDDGTESGVRARKIAVRRR